MNDKKWNLQTIVLYGINSVIGSGIFCYRVQPMII